MTTTNSTLNLQLEPAKLTTFCKKIIARSRNTANIHEALVVLEAFVSNFSSDSQGSVQYRAIQDCLQAFSAQTREQLMKQRCLQLKRGLLEQNIDLLADVYNSLSRNGFYQILASLMEEIDYQHKEDISCFISWVLHWSTTAREKAERASGYPDALDFNKAQIKVDHYQTMSDISYFFKNMYKKHE